MSRLTASIVGGSGYTGGELLRLLLQHPHVQVQQVTSRSAAGKSVGRVHPNLRGTTPLQFSAPDQLHSCDVLFLCLPHGTASVDFDRYADFPRVIDLSADFRLDSAAAYERYYGQAHARPDLLEQFVYGIPELHRGQMRSATRISSAGCNATATILGLLPLYRAGLVDADRTVVEVKVGSSEAGQSAGPGSHHPERAGCVRSFKPTGHRHVAEILQALSGGDGQMHFSATALDMVRGVLATCHVFLTETLDERRVWQLYREAYQDEPFIRLIKQRDGHYRYPEPKLLAGTNYCDIGFECDPHTNRVVVLSAIDNLMKGAAGQAVQAMNLMNGWDERAGLHFLGMHP